MYEIFAVLGKFGRYYFSAEVGGIQPANGHSGRPAYVRTINSAVNLQFNPLFTPLELSFEQCI